MRVVLDTNVIVSALLVPQSVPGRVLNLLLTGDLTIVYDNSLLIEYIEVLQREKFKINKELAVYITDFIKMEGQFAVSNPQKIRFTDPSDRKFYEVFKTCEADYLITGNKKHFPMDRGIVTPREFLEKEYL